MNNSVQLSKNWLKASIIGTIWAASEIILGSFLHNLRVPFSGTILTAIAVVLLVSVSFVWKEKGIFWRAGLICALMKTLSPSAVIFGPMVAIFTESLLLEGAVRIFGKTYLGFLVGSVLAVSWSFVQKVINFLIFYGFNIVEVYKGLAKFAEKQLNLNFDIFWMPILIILLVYAFVGIFAAFIGIKTGKKLVSQPIEYSQEILNNQSFIFNKNSKSEFNYSLIWLLVDFLLIVTALLLISFTDWKIWGIAIVAITSLWIVKYKRALRQLAKPRFWLFFVVITMLTAVVFTKFQSKSLLDAFLIGIEMNFRATVMILGFSVLGTELYNPKIRDFFSKTHFKYLPVALELSAESLPQVIANIPDVKTVFKSPVKVISQLIAYAEYRFQELNNSQDFSRKIFIVTGKIDAGKTSFIVQLINFLKAKNINVSGIYSQKIFEESERIGYDVVDIETNKRAAFLRTSANGTSEKVGEFYIFPEGLQFGLERLKSANQIENQIVIVDEVGKLELAGKGWASELDKLASNNKNHLLLAAREDFVEEIIAKWKLNNARIINIPGAEFRVGTKRIIDEIEMQ